MENIIQEITILNTELSTLTFKQFHPSKNRSIFKQEFSCNNIKFGDYKGEASIIIKNFFIPKGLFRAEFGFIISFEFSKELTQDMINEEVLKNAVIKKSRVFAENSYMLSFLTDRAFDYPLVFPPHPVDEQP